METHSMVNAMHASVILEWHWGTISLAILTLTVSITALLHLLIHHRDHRSAGFWFALIVFSPLIGACLYGLLGINFVRRRGQQYRGNIGPAYHEPLPDFPSFADTDPLQLERDGLLAITLDRISRFHFSESNDVTPLVNGDEAMPAMLEAIRQAQTSIALSSYIFEATHIGAQFVEALTEAHQRGVEVRVMVDDAGTRYSWPPITRVLRKRGVLVRRFMPNRFVLRLLTMNLRNHKKILVVDGFIGFTGGMNIREGNMLARNPAHPVQDLHFKIIGPVVAQMQGVFAEDWQFCAGEILEGPAWFPPIEPAGKTHVLGIVDGPDEDLEVMPVALFAALSAATDRVCVMTPYFLPTVILMAALKLCATRGVKVTIVTPAKNNIPVVSWAARTLYAELLEAGCHIYESPGPFDHSKMLLIDGTWSCIGSTNWDPRSLRLNFEFNLACRCHTLNAQLASIFEAKKQASQEITLDALKDTSTSIRLRNGLARLFIPVL